MKSDTAFSSRMEDFSGTTMMMGLRVSAGRTADASGFADAWATTRGAHSAEAVSSDPIRTTTI